MNKAKYNIKEELKRIGNKNLREEARAKLPELTGLTKKTLKTYMYQRKGVSINSPYVHLIESMIEKYVEKENELLNAI